MSAIRLSFLGAGAMALRQAQALIDAGLAPRAIVAVYDRNLAAAHAFADRFGVCVAESPRAALQAATHAVIATAAAAHADAALLALEMRRAVFVEKPLALSVRDGAALAVLAQRLAVTLHVGMSERFHPVVRALFADLDGRRADAVHAARHVEAMRARDCDVTMNLGVHDVDLALELVRKPFAIDRASTTRSSKHLELRLIGEGGAIACIEASSGARARRTLAVHAGPIRYEADLLAGTLVRHTPRGSAALPISLEDGLVAQARALLGIWSGGATRGPATARDAFRGLALLARAGAVGTAISAETPENLPSSASFG
jgi:predicted dehydrogenase